MADTALDPIDALTFETLTLAEFSRLRNVAKRARQLAFFPSQDEHLMLRLAVTRLLLGVKGNVRPKQVSDIALALGGEDPLKAYEKQESDDVLTGQEREANPPAEAAQAVVGEAGKQVRPESDV